MQLELKRPEDCMFDEISLGEIMLRLDPGAGRIKNSRSFTAWEGGGEYNVARGLRRCFGLRTAVITALADNEVGRLIEDFILQGGVDTSFIKWMSYDGIGRNVRNGLNFTERGYGIRGAVGVSDRGNTAASQLRAEDVDWDYIFGKLGVRWLHTGGIFAALSETSAETDYSGTVDGVAFTGGTYSGYSLKLGSGTFIDGFEDQIVGHNVGDTFDVKVTFPEGYSDSTDAEGNTLVLSGKEAVFSVTLNGISEEVQPELTDAWVDETLGTSNDLHSVEALRAFYQQQLYQTNLQTAVMDYLLQNSTFGDIPKSVLDYQVTQCLNYYYTMGGHYGYELDAFVQMMGYDNADAMLAAMADSIESYAKEALLYQAVAEAMDLAPTQEQIDTYSAYTEAYGANYCTMIALMDTVTDALTTGAQVK